MIKRLLAALLLAAGLMGVGSWDPATAGCTAANRGGSAGEYDTASTTFGDVTIDAAQYGNFVSGPAYLCSDGSSGVEPAARGKLEIRVGGDVVCSNTQRLVQDPFLFGAAVHSAPSDPCGAEITFTGAVESLEANAADLSVGSEGASGGVRKQANVSGSFWYGGVEYQVPPDATGYYTRGLKAASEH